MELLEIRKRLDLLLDAIDQSEQILDNDKRVWGLEKDPYLGPVLKNLFRPQILKSFAFYKTESLNLTFMGNRVEPGDLGSGGGWHQDSIIRKQYKAFCYLNDVKDVDDGAFQYFKLKDSLMLRISELVKGNFSNRINRSIDTEKAISCLYKGGEVFDIDTRLVHRGSPIKGAQKKRYCITLYAYGKKTPSTIPLSQLNLKSFLCV